MARILPDPLVGAVAPEVLRVYRVLKAVPGDDVTAWMCLPLPGASEARPEFLVLHRNTTAFLLTIATTSQSEAEEVVHGGLFTEARQAPSDLGLPHRELAREFVAAVLASTNAGDGGAAAAVFNLVLYPNVAHATLRQAFSENPHDDVYWLGDEHVTADGLQRSFARLASGTLSEPVLATLRARFTPESVMPYRFSPRRRLERRVEAELTPLLLDYDQEWWTKHRLSLPDAARQVAEEPTDGADAALVTGVAGSGKSLVLLFRACTQARLRPDSRSLVLTHNRALRHELEARFGELGAPPNVEWNTFFGWADRWLNVQPERPATVQYEARDELIAAAAEPVFGALDRRQVEFLRDEIDWMKDRALTLLSEYTRADRAGRGVRLSDAQRERVFRVFGSYEAMLGARQLEDWSGRALRFWRLVESGVIGLPSYDFIYVDEAQFFAPVWFRAVRRALHPETGRLFLAADPTQGFLKRRQSWIASGIDLRGRSTRLRRSYRNARPILALAAAFYRRRLGEEDEELNIPDDTELASAPDGEAPRLIPLTSRQDEITRVAREVEAFVKGGGDPSDILVLVAQGSRSAEMHAALVQAVGEARVVNARHSAARGAVRMCGLDAGTGLEAPIVFLLGAAELLEKEDDLQCGAEQRAELRRDNTRRLYMAFTRAAQRLVVTWVGPGPEWWPAAEGGRSVER